MGTGPARAILRTDTTEGNLPYIAWIHVNTMPFSPTQVQESPEED